MKQLDIRFQKEHHAERAKEQARIIERLQERLPALIEAEFGEVAIRVRTSSSAGVDVSGFRDSDEKKRFMTFLEELWNDNSLVEDSW